MSNSTTWVGMDVHKENIVTVSISGDSGTVMTRWETPNTAKGKERLAAGIAGTWEGTELLPGEPSATPRESMTGKVSPAISSPLP